MKTEIALRNFGLTDAEIAIYLALLTHGASSASKLSEKTSKNRTFTYDRLKKLSDLGLVSYAIKDNKKYFKPADPSQLLSILKERQLQVESILPELNNLKSKEAEGPDVKIFSTKKGIRTVLNLILRDKKELLIHGSLNKFKEIMPSYFEIFNKRRTKEKIKTKVLSYEDINIEKAEIDLLDEQQKSNITTFTFGDKVVIIMWSSNPVAILIENENIANDNKSFFNTIWNREVRIYSGVDGILKAFYEIIEKPAKFHVGFGYSEELAKVYGKKMSDDWHIKRLKLGVKSKLISYNDNDSKKYFKKRMRQWKSFDVKFLDKTICGPACITLTNHTIATFIYTEKNLKVIVSKNKEMIQTYKKHFESLWKLAKSK